MKLLDAKQLGVSPRTKIIDYGAFIAIVIERKSRIIMKDGEKIIEKAKDQIENEKMKAITELKNNVAQLTIEIATKVIKTELSDESKQKTFIDSELKKSNLN